MSLVLHREENETWLEAAQRNAKQYGVEVEVTACYYEFLLIGGVSESQAAFDACYEWDVLTFEKDEPE